LETFFLLNNWNKRSIERTQLIVLRARVINETKGFEEKREQKLIGNV
tara:strand:- start:51 stop:191 length:141 start_codon:yes stop_codon:yes gene_type:complete